MAKRPVLKFGSLDSPLSRSQTQAVLDRIAADSTLCRCALDLLPSPVKDRDKNEENFLAASQAEMAFLADPAATHPAYVQRHLIDTDIHQTPELIASAYGQQSAARLLLVKGAVDYVVRDGEIVATVTEPDVPAMEAIGGTGDTITGMVSAFVYAGLEPPEAAVIAARANRMAGKMAAATPATRVGQVNAKLPEVFQKYLCEWSGVCRS